MTPVTPSSTRTTKRKTKRRKRDKNPKRKPGVVAAPKAPKPVVPADHPRQTIGNTGGMLLTGGVKGNRGGVIGLRRRQIRAGLLRIVAKRGGMKLLGDIVAGLPVQPIRTAKGELLTAADGSPQLGEAGLDLRQRTVIDCLQYGLGQLNQHNLVDEQDQSLERSVVELPALNAPPVPPESLEAVEVQTPLVQPSPGRSVDAARRLRGLLRPGTK
jgi:hypothetical protein